LDIFRAAAEGDERLLAALLAAGAPVNAVARDDAALRTALHRALEGEEDEDEMLEVEGNGDESEMQTVRLLLAHKADVNVADAAGRTPLHQAVSRGRHALARLLLSAGADPSHRWKHQTCLHAAVFRQDAKMVAVLLAAACFREGEEGRGLVDAAGRDGWTALGFAARCGHVAMAKLLLEAGASPTVAAEVSGKTPLQIATVNKKVAVVELIERYT
jgi:ankyrin repeat protein